MIVGEVNEHLLCVLDCMHPWPPPPAGEVHFHVCASCFYIWCHKPEQAEGNLDAHNCPKCKAGPFKDAWMTYRAAHEEKVRLKEIANV